VSEANAAPDDFARRQAGAYLIEELRGETHRNCYPPISIVLTSPLARAVSMRPA
jgi:hypothetical protein